MGLIYISTALLALVALFGNTKTTASNPCSIDAVLYSTETEDIYFFKDDMYARWNVQADNMYYYGQTKDLINGLNTPVNAAIETNAFGTKQIYFFSGNQVQIYDHFHKNPLDTISLKDFAAGLPDSIDAALLLGNSFYFFKDNHFYNMTGQKSISGPFNISEAFPGLPTPVDAAVFNTIRPDDKTAYLFSGENYYIYGDDASKHEVSADNHPIKEGWKGLLDSPLFAKCGIDCNTVTISNDDWKFGSISYNMTKGSYNFMNGKSI